MSQENTAQAQEPEVISVDMAEIRQQSDIAVTEANKVHQSGAKLTIRSAANLSAASELLLTVKKIAKAVKADKKRLMDPIKIAQDDIKDRFKPAEEMLANTEAIIKAAIQKYHTSLEKRAENQANKIEEAVDQGSMGLAEGMAKISSVKQAPTSIKQEQGTIQVKNGPRKIRIIDASKIPPSYFMRERVLEALRLEISQDVIKNGMECPDGAEVYQEKVVAGVAA